MPSAYQTQLCMYTIARHYCKLPQCCPQLFRKPLFDRYLAPSGWPAPQPPLATGACGASTAPGALNRCTPGVPA
eukprot:2159-Heterococcus_DN1.PRE.1